MSAIYTKVNHTYNAELELDKISYSMKIRLCSQVFIFHLHVFYLSDSFQK